MLLLLLFVVLLVPVENRGYTGLVKTGVTADLTAYFSATFHSPYNINFRYDLDRAVDEGYVTELLMLVACVIFIAV